MSCKVVTRQGRISYINNFSPLSVLAERVSIDYQKPCHWNMQVNWVDLTLTTQWLILVPLLALSSSSKEQPCCPLTQLEQSSSSVGHSENNKQKFVVGSNVNHWQVLRSLQFLRHSFDDETISSWSKLPWIAISASMWKLGFWISTYLALSWNIALKVITSYFSCYTIQAIINWYFIAVGEEFT